MKKELEEGVVIEISEDFWISSNHTVFVHNIPVGTLENNLTWFEQSDKPKLDEIKEIVYLGNYQWGYKHLHNPLAEFNKLSEEAKEEVLRYYNIYKTQCDRI